MLALSVMKVSSDAFPAFSKQLCTMIKTWTHSYAYIPQMKGHLLTLSYVSCDQYFLNEARFYYLFFERQAYIVLNFQIFCEML